MPFSFKPALAIAAASLALAGCSHTYTSSAGDWAGQRVTGSGIVVEEARAISPTSELVVHSAVDIALVRGAPALTLEGDDNILPLVEFAQAGDRTTVQIKGNTVSKNPVKAHLALPDLRLVRVNGSGDVALYDWNTESLVIEVNGSGEVTLHGEAGNVRALVNGSGGIDLTNASLDFADADVNGSGEIRLGSLRHLEARVSGSGDIEADDVGLLEVVQNGSGNITYGSAERLDVINDTGSGKIRQR